MPGKPNLHRLALAHLKGLCQEFNVKDRPRLYTKRWPKEFGDIMAMYVHDSNAIYINIKKHDDVGQIYDSVGHELAHHITKKEECDHGPKWRKAATEFGATTDT